MQIKTIDDRITELERSTGAIRVLYISVCMWLVIAINDTYLELMSVGYNAEGIPVFVWADFISWIAGLVKNLGIIVVGSLVNYFREEKKKKVEIDEETGLVMPGLGESGQASPKKGPEALPAAQTDGTQGPS